MNTGYRVLITGTVTDELTGLPPTGELTVSTDRKQLVPKVLDSGLFCLAGESRLLFPQLATQAESLNLSITVPGYKPFLYRLSIGAGSIFPLPTLAIKLQRVPVRIQGYVVEAVPMVNIPVRHARVRCTAASSIIGMTTSIATLRTPLHHDHQVGTLVQSCQLMPEGSSGQLIVSASAGSSALVLNNSMTVAVGDVLSIGTEVMGDYVIVEQCEVIANQLLLVSCTSTLPYSFAAGTIVQRYRPGVITGETTLSRAGIMDEGLLYLTSPLQLALPPAPSTVVLKISDSDTARAEYHSLDALTDDSGYYRLDGIGGAQNVQLEAYAVEIGANATTVKWMIDYGKLVNNVDFRLMR